MKYIVIKPFRDISGFKSPGETIELDDNRAAKLRSQGLIGGVVKKSSPEKELTKTELEELASIYPESKVYEKKLSEKKKETKKPSKKVK